MGAGNTGNWGKCKRSMRLSESWGKEPKECAKGENVESCSRVKDENRRLAQGEDKARKIWKEYFEDMYNIDIQEDVAVHMSGFDRVRRGN